MLRSSNALNFLLPGYSDICEHLKDFQSPFVHISQVMHEGYSFYTFLLKLFRKSIYKDV